MKNHYTPIFLQDLFISSFVLDAFEEIIWPKGITTSDLLQNFSERFASSEWKRRISLGKFRCNEEREESASALHRYEENEEEEEDKKKLYTSKSIIEAININFELKKKFKAFKFFPYFLSLLLCTNKIE